MKLTFLGTGCSTGTPGVFEKWGVCNPENPKNRRLRPSILVKEESTILLVDTSPDLREQCLRAGITRLSAVLYTHEHADHLHGIDDLRAINRAMDSSLDCYGPVRTLESIRHRFPYVFEPLVPTTTFHYKPTLIPHKVHNGELFHIGKIPVTAFEQDHGYSTSVGYRLGNLAFCTDVVRLSDAAFNIICGVDVMVVGVLSDLAHETHAHVDLAIEWIRRAGAKKGYLTHLGTRLDHKALEQRLPDDIRPAFDGLSVEIL